MTWQPPQYDPQAHEQHIRGQQQHAPQPPPWQQPGYGQSPYMPQPPPRRRKSWPRRHKILTSLLAGCGLILAIGIAAAAAAPKTASPPAAPAAGPQGAHQAVTYIVTGSKGAQVTYGPAGSNLTGTVPMHITKPIGSASYYSIDAQLQGSGHVTCKIEVGGAVISSATAAGGYNIASCEITQDPLSGQWQDANS